MKFKGTVEPKGELTISLFGPDGKLKDERKVKNLVVTRGKEYIAGRMINNSTTLSHMGIGTGTTAPAVGQTALVIQTGRVAFDTATATGATATYTANFPAGIGTGAITEAGLFDASTGGNMIARTTFGVITKGVDDVMAISWGVTVQ